MKPLIQAGTLTELLNTVAVAPGDVFFIEAGTIHAIGAGILIAEIQQNSNLTYRVFDYNRMDADGKPRQLHIEQALAATTLTPPPLRFDFNGHLVFCDYFTVDRLIVDKKQTSFADRTSFQHLLILSGEGMIISEDECLSFQRGDSLMLTAGSGEYTIR